MNVAIPQTRCEDHDDSFCCRKCCDCWGATPTNAKYSHPGRPECTPTNPCAECLGGV